MATVYPFSGGLQHCVIPANTSRFHVLLDVFWGKRALHSIEKLPWKVTTKSDAGLSHQIVRTSAVDPQRVKKPSAVFPGQS